MGQPATSPDAAALHAQFDRLIDHVAEGSSRGDFSAKAGGSSLEAARLHLLVELVAGVTNPRRRRVILGGLTQSSALRFQVRPG